ncbi:MAG: hypothetical protein Kow0099_27380 [Candidatus Abyssubacteria bacterium]
MLKKRRGITWLVLSLLACGVLAAAGLRFAGEGFLEAIKKGKKPNIVLVSIDTLRGDFFSEEHMPQTMAWAEKNCLIFEGACSNSTWTLPAHVTMLTGLLPHEHGVEYHDSHIGADISMVQEQLQKEGYHTVAVMGGGFVGSQ